MKKFICAVLAAAFIVFAVCGCTEKASTGMADDDILTYRKLDPDKTTLIVSRTGNIYIDAFSAEFEKRNPDIQVVCIDITGGNNFVKPSMDWIDNGFAPDVMFWSGNLISDDYIKVHFTNLSAKSYTANYQSEALNDVAIGANIYCIPCPSDVQCIIYNKTLFERYGWQTPSTFDEFIALCDRITSDTNGEIEPWNPNAKYSNEFMTTMEGFLYEELFGGAENRSWYDSAVNNAEVAAGDVAEHLRPYYDTVQKLIDHGILKTEHFSYSATQRMKDFQAGKIAMINFKASVISSDEYEFEFMPFPGTTGDSGYICKYYNALVGVPNVQRDEATQNAIERYLEFFSSVEGQNTFIGGTLQISNVKNMTSTASSSLSSLQPTIDEGHQFMLLSFTGKTTKVNFSPTDDARLMTAGEKTGEECIAALAADPYSEYNSGPQSDSEVLANVSEDFTILDTSFYIADMYREKTGADIGLIENNIAYGGNLMRMFKGELTEDDVKVLLPRSFTNDSKLVKANMTGQQLMDALNDPLGQDGQTADCVYAYSGLICSVAPWQSQGQRILSVTLSDGSAIEMDKIYTVAFWSGTVFEKYITGTVEEYEGSWVSFMTEKLKADITLPPSRDGRISLIWK